MSKYRKKPVVIEALQWTGDNWGEMWRFCITAIRGEREDRGITIPTLEGDHLANVGDWIIKGVKGEFYPCKPDVFTQTYEAVADD